MCKKAKLRSDLDESQTKVIKLANIYSNPEYQKVENNYIQGQQRIAQALTIIESIPLKKEIKDKIVNTLASTKN